MTEKKHFRLFVDTGGTFTDCIGFDETGKEHRQKVLSSSSLRGTIVKVISEFEIEISDHWNLDRDILKGFTFRLLGAGNFEAIIENFDHKTKSFRLNRSIGKIKNPEGRNFEITSGEEAPVLGARLITQTALASSDSQIGYDLRFISRRQVLVCRQQTM